MAVWIVLNPLGRKELRNKGIPFRTMINRITTPLENLPDSCAAPFGFCRGMTFLMISSGRNVLQVQLHFEMHVLCILRIQGFRLFPCVDS
jgi:hypothetical protein